MKDIKFRGKRYDDKTWIYGSLLEDDIIVVKGATSVDFEYIGFDDEWSTILKETVGQYTGLKDCNDVEVYEGDIVENFLTDRFEIKYIEDKARFSIGEDNINKTIVKTEKIKVIGNIYENPELLLEK